MSYTGDLADRQLRKRVHNRGRKRRKTEQEEGYRANKNVRKTEAEAKARAAWSGDPFGQVEKPKTKQLQFGEESAEVDRREQ